MRTKMTLVIWTFFAAFCGAQSPEGWKKLSVENGVREAPPGPGWEKEERDENGIQFLGSWEREDGEVTLAVGTFQKMPAMQEILGMQHDNVDPSDFPVRVESLEAPLLGMRFWFDQDDDGREEMERMFMMQKNGGQILLVELKPAASFDPGPWLNEDKLHPDEKVLRAGFDARAAEMTMLIKNPPKIQISSKLEPPVTGGKKKSGNHMRVEVTVLDGPKYLVGGKEKTTEELEQLFKDAVKKAAGNGEVDPVLHIRAATETPFSSVRRLIRLGAKAGIEQVAYRSFPPKESD